MSQHIEAAVDERGMIARKAKAFGKDAHPPGGGELLIQGGGRMSERGLRSVLLNVVFS